ncbi:Eukaryotic translation initiation factor 2B, subunit 3 gamma, 58kDa [Dermatophagoides pteronyssinus]|uniref:Translation initiation factor eIF2B subunit gamma n=1 Tax=Dermatophagoides pteronyssinus TaxID=6956 RepID=A0ABQ8JDH0_DERPT|nr:Eukaryotic translation initiation factor 2B, subunit 3 gamma, 58kDa [Dermatophagoides pteronyssinus]
MMIENRFDYEFHTIVLAGGRGSRMNHILHGRPKCLLPIANRPMIQYSLELLQRHNILEAFIIVLDNEEHQIKNAVAALGLDIQLRFITIPHTEDYATADSLRAIHKQEKLTKDILLVSCDLVADIDLDRFIELYRLRNSTFLCAFSSQLYPKENLMPAIKLSDNKEFDYVGLDGNDLNRLVFYEPDAMLNDSIPLKRSIFKSCPYLQLRTDLIDSHIYLFRNWILDYLKHETGIRSIKFDLLPSLVRKQFRRLNSNRSTESSRSYENDEQTKKSKHIIDFIRTPELECYMARINLKICDNDEQEESSLSSINCGALIVNTGHLVRVNNLTGFCEANRFLVDQKSTHSQNRGSLVSNSSKLGDKTLLKRTIIGNNCTIGDNCQFTNCIIQDNVTIENNCKLINSVVCSEAHIEENVLLENCLVSPRYRVIEQSRYRNESLIQEMLDLI